MKSKLVSNKVEKIINIGVIFSPEKTSVENLKISEIAKAEIVIIETMITTVLDQSLNFHNPKAIAAKRAAHNP